VKSHAPAVDAEETGPPGPVQAAEALAADGGRTVLQRELSSFLVGLSIALHRFAMYPPGHPSLAPVLEGLARRADTLLQGRPRFAVGVARDRLVIEGVVTDARHPLLRGLAERLHRHHLAALWFGRGLTMAELAEVVAAIAEDPDRSGSLGRRPAGQAPAWPHVSLHPLTVDSLEIVGARGTGDAAPLRSAELWVGLAQAAMGRGAEATGRALADEPAVIARAIDEHQRAEAYDQVIVGYLLQIAEEVRHAGNPDTLELRRRVSALVSAMNPETLQRLVAMGGHVLQRQQFLQNATIGMSAGAVVDLVKAAAEGANESLSTGLVRMLTKLAAHAEAGRPAVQPLADSALRAQVARLTAGWAPDPNPTEYTAMLQQIAQAVPQAAPDQVDFMGMPAEPLRLLQMCLELGDYGPVMWRALDAMVDGGELAGAAAQLAPTRAGDHQGRQVWEHLTSADTVRKLLARVPPDFSAIDALLPHLRGAALDPLFDVLIESDDRHVRRAAFDRLRQTGRQGARLAFSRMASDRWYVTRNLLALLAEMADLPAECNPTPWLAHPDARVRREALRVALRIGPVREGALLTALVDADDRVLRVAIAAASASRHPETIRRLLGLASRETLDDSVRALAVQALAEASRSRNTLNLLLRVASRGAWLGLRPALAPKSQTVVAALSALAAKWPRDRRACALVRSAAHSPDAEMRQAAKVQAP
jgi:hypothetical protein